MLNHSPEHSAHVPFRKLRIAAATTVGGGVLFASSLQLSTLLLGDTLSPDEKAIMADTDTVEEWYDSPSTPIGGEDQDLAMAAKTELRGTLGQLTLDAVDNGQAPVVHILDAEAGTRALDRLVDDAQADRLNYAMALALAQMTLGGVLPMAFALPARAQRIDEQLATLLPADSAQNP